jgi:hypothetical protein
MSISQQREMSATEYGRTDRGSHLRVAVASSLARLFPNFAKTLQVLFMN